MTFSVGDEVVCVDDGPPPAGFARTGPPEVQERRGTHYIVADVGPWNWHPGDWVRLEGMGHWRYLADRFRPVKREAIQLFRDMAASPKPLVPVEDGVSGVIDTEALGRFLRSKGL